MQDFEEDSQWCDPDENLAVCSANNQARIVTRKFESWGLPLQQLKVENFRLGELGIHLMDWLGQAGQVFGKQKKNLINGNAITSLRDKAMQVEVESEVRQLNIMLDSAVMSMASVLDLCQEYIIQSGFPANIDHRAKNIQEKMEILETKSTETTVGSILLRFNILLNSWDVEENPGPSPFRSLFFHCN